MQRMAWEGRTERLAILYMSPLPAFVELGDAPTRYRFSLNQKTVCRCVADLLVAIVAHHAAETKAPHQNFHDSSAH